MSSIAQKALKALAVLASPFVAYIAYSNWDIHNVSAFCGEIHAGTPLSTLPKLGENYGINTRSLTSGVYDDQQKSWVLFVPAGSTFGDITCDIRYNKGIVISAKMTGE